MLEVFRGKMGCFGVLSRIWVIIGFAARHGMIEGFSRIVRFKGLRK